MGFLPSNNSALVIDANETSHANNGNEMDCVIGLLEIIAASIIAR
jgi:hypothetical protein